MQHYLISYDVSCGKTRDRLFRLQKKEGRRVQFSVFIVDPSHLRYQKLERDLLAIIGEEDSLLCMPLCGHCLAEAMITCAKFPVLDFF